MQPFFAACYAQSFGVALTTTTRHPMTVNTKHYEAKVKRLLMDFALGMLPGQPWEATDLASGVFCFSP